MIFGGYIGQCVNFQIPFECLNLSSVDKATAIFLALAGSTKN